jgi:hypothetical protein
VDDWKPVPPSSLPKPEPVPPKDAAAAPPAPKPNTAAARRTYSFSLGPGHEFKRVGPIEVALRSVDARQNRISLSIRSDSARLNFPHVRLNQSVRVNAGGHGRRLELVIDRIAPDGVYGHLME